MLVRSLAIALLLSLAPLCDAAEARFERFIVITVDTLRSDHLGCYGYAHPVSPAIDEFAAKATRFEWAFSAAPSTHPSMYAMHTSRYAGLGEHLLANGQSWAPVKPPTIASTLLASGAATAAFVGNFVLRESCGLSTGFETYNDDFDSVELNRAFPERICSSLAPAAAAWLETNANRPFFLWMHFQDPHGPYTPPAPHDERFAVEGAQGRELPLLEHNGGAGGIPKYQQLGDHRNYEYYRSRYDGEINFLDAHLGAFLKRVEDLGLMETTVIVFTADHGEAFGERNHFFCHGHAVTPELTHVPLLMYVPGRASSAEKMPVSLIDIAPTIAELAGLDAPEAYMGESLIQTVANGGREGAIFTETAFALAAVEGEHMLVWGKPHPETGLPENNKAHNPKSIGFFDGPITLHAYRADPFCDKDVSEDGRQWFRYLRGVCQEYLRLSARHKAGGEELAIDDETRRALEALGYLSD